MRHMTHTIRRGVLAGLVVGTLVLVNGCGGSDAVNPRSEGTPDPKAGRIGMSSSTGGAATAPEDKGGKPAPNASLN